MIICGVVLDSGETLAAPEIKTRKALFYGDSHSEGVGVTAASTQAGRNSRIAFPQLIADALNVECSTVGFANIGYNQTGSDYPAVKNSWSDYYSGASRLSGGSFSEGQPDYIFLHLGHNDNAGTVQSSVEETITEMRAAAPTAVIFVCLPPNLTCEAAITAAELAVGDANTQLIDHNEVMSATGSYIGPDGVHLSVTGQQHYSDLIVPLVTPFLLGEDTPTNTTPPAIAGTPTEGQTLTLTPGVWEDEDSVATQWYENGSASTSGGTPISAVTVARYSHKGKYLYVGEIGTNGEGDSDEVFSNIIGPIAGAVGQGPRINGGLVRCI